jgi:hypothetical protein
MATYDEPMPKWLEEELGLVKPAERGPVQGAKPERAPPIDRWWKRGEECPH